MDERSVVTCFLRRGPDVLLVRRSDAVGTYPGRWGGVSGFLEGSPRESARREIAEETGLLGSIEPVDSADTLVVEDPSLGVRWRVHPFLFDCDFRDVDPDEEVADHEWVQPPTILERETVPRLWETYRAVAPTVETVREDRNHGSAYVSLRAMEVLRDRAAEASSRSGSYVDVAELARDLRSARPSMGVVANRVNRAMSEAESTPASVRDAAIEGCKRAVGSDTEAATAAADLLGERVLTLSRSGTVLEALRRADPEAVYVAESRPAREGVGVAEMLADDGVDVTLLVDAAIGHVLAEEGVDTVLVGADSVLADGAVVNKVGTRLTALAAAEATVDCYAVCAQDKVVPEMESEEAFESGPGGAVYDGAANVHLHNPTFETTPVEQFTGVVTEDGVCSGAELQAVANEHAELADWSE